MNPFFVSILLCFGITFTALAEPAAPAAETHKAKSAAAPAKAGKHHESTLDQLGNEFELNEKQKFKIKSLFKQKKQELKALKEALKEEKAASPQKEGNALKEKSGKKAEKIHDIQPPKE